MLLERAQPLGELESLVEAASRGTGSLVLVAGEAGAGKTSLVRAFVESRDQYTLVVQGACDPLTTPRPLSPLFDFNAEQSGWFTDPGLGGDIMTVFRSVLARLRSSTRPVVMVIEDIHWADEATLDFLRFIGRRVGTSMAVVICTYRDDEVGRDHPLHQVLGQLLPLASTIRLEVPALSLNAVKTLASGTPLDPASLHDLTGGNAFFVTEVIATGTTLPATVNDAVLARVAALPRGAREVVESISIAPRFLEVERALHMVGSVADSVDMAVSSGVIQSENQRLRFRHELARAAVEESIPPARRHELHGRMLALLLEEKPPDHARLAHHAVRAQSPTLVIEHAPVAARQAVERGARREAAMFFRAALDQSDLLEGDVEARLRFEFARELRHLDRQEAALAELDSAIAHYRATQNDVLLAEALTDRQNVLWYLGRLEAAWAAGREGLAILRPLGPSKALGYALYRAAHHHMLARHAAPARRAVGEAITIANAVDSTEVRWLATMIGGTVEIVLGDGRSGVRQLQECRAQAIALGSRLYESIALSMLGSGGGECRLYDDALAALDDSIEIAVANDQDHTAAYDQSWKARIAFEQGRWDDAIREAGAAMRIAGRSDGIAYLTAMGAVGRVRVRRGDAGGSELLSEVIEAGKTAELQHVWSPIAGLAEYHWLRGEYEAMSGVLRQPYERALDTDSPWARGELGFWMWRTGAIATAPAGAAEPFALQMAGDWRAAAAVWREIGCPYEVASALADGDTDAILEAVSLFDALGAGPMARRTREALRRAGVSSIPRGPRRSTRSNPGGLTDRQLEVLELVAEGRSNAQIADTLDLSRKTVEHHVSAILGKLEVTTRDEAVAIAMSEAPPET